MAQLAVLAIPFVGQAVGGWIGGALGAAGLGAALGGFGGAWLANRLFGPGSRAVEGPRLSDKRVQTAEYGTAIPWVHGAMRVAGNIIWANKLIEKRQTDTKNGVKTRTYYYFGQFAVAFCKGPVQRIRRIWADDKLIVDYTDNSNKKATKRYRKAPKGVDIKVATRVYLGDEDQEPDPLIESVEGAGKVPAFRGLCYVVFENLPLKDFGNRIPQISAEIVQSSSEANTVTVHTQNFSPAQNEIVAWNDEWAVNEDGTIAYFTGHSWIEDADMIVAVDLRSMRPLWSMFFDDRNPRLSALHNNITGPYAYISAYSPAVYSPYTRNLYLCSNTATYFTYVAEIRAEDGAVLRVWRVPTNNGWGAYAFDKYLVVGLLDTIGSESLVVYDLSRWPNPRDPNAGPVKVAAIQSFEVGAIYETAIVATKDYLVAYDASQDKIITMRIGTWQTNYYNVVSVFGFDPGPHCYLMYDPATEKLIAVTYGGSPIRTRIFRIDPATMTVEKTYVGTGNAFYPIGRPFHEFGRVVRDGQFWIFVDDSVDQFRLIDTASMRVVRTRNLTSWPSHRYTPVTYNPDTSSFLTFQYYSQTDRHVASLHEERITVNQQQLRNLVEALCYETGLTASDVDAAELTDYYWGFMVSQPSSVRAVLEMLSDPFMFDIVESDGKLKFRKRNKTPVATISWDEMGVRTDSSNQREDVLVETRAQELELPRRIVLTCLNPKKNYNTISFQAQRWQNIVSPVDEEVVELPMALSTAVASKIPHVLLGAAWTERVRLSFDLAVRRAALEPGDVIVVQKTGAVSATYRVRLVQTVFGADWRLQCEGVVTDSVYFEVDSVPDSDSENPPEDDTDSIPFTAPTRLFLLNLPCRSSADDGFLGFHMAAGPVSATADSGWAGCDVGRSADGVAYDLYTTLLSPVQHGIADTVLPAVPNWASWDTTSALEITVLTSSWVPTSSTDLEVLNGANRILVGDEIVAFVDVTPLGGNRYRLTRLLRGLHSTDFAVAEHKPFERVINLSDPDIVRVGDGSERGLEFWYSAYSHNYEGNEEPPQKFKSIAACMMPYSPAVVSRSRSGSGASASVTVTWERRTRFGGGLVDGTGEVPLNEVEELYEVDVRDPQGRLLRTVRQSAKTYTYQLSQYLSDAGIGSPTFTCALPALGFETGELGGWTTQSGRWFVTAASTITPRSGEFFVYAVSDGSVLRYVLDVTELVPLEQVDTGTGTVVFTVWQSRLGGSKNGRHRLILRDAADAVLATYESSNATFATWTERTVSGTLLVGTRSLVLELVGGEDVAFDDARLRIDGLFPTLTFEIYQISRTVGRGFVRRTRA